MILSVVCHNSFSPQTYLSILFNNFTNRLVEELEYVPIKITHVTKLEKGGAKE